MGERGTGISCISIDWSHLLHDAEQADMQTKRKA